VRSRVLSGLTIALMLAAPSVALAQPTPTTSPLGSGVTPLAPIPTTTSTTVPTVVTNSSTSGGSSLSGSSAIAIALGAIIVLAGISFFIWRDARRRAPIHARHADAAAGPDGRTPGSKRVKPRKLSPAERRRRKRGRARR